MQYCCAPLDFNTHCNGCEEKFTVQHALTCKVQGLISMRHNEVKEELTSLCTKALNPSVVQGEPLIIPSKETIITEAKDTIVET